MNHLYSLPFSRPSPRISCSLVEENQQLREKIAHIIEREPGYECLEVYENVEEAFFDILRYPPHVLFVNATKNGVDCVRELKIRKPNLDVLMILRSYDSSIVFDSLAAGASGFINQKKTDREIIKAIDSIISGGAPMCPRISRMIVDSFRVTGKSNLLTQREKDVLTQLCTGKSYKLIADVLFISQDTVRSHIKNIYRKLGVNSKSEAVAKALRNHWV